MMTTIDQLESKNFRSYGGSSFDEDLVLDLSRNEGQTVLEPRDSGFSADELALFSRYPNLESLRKSLATAYQVDPARVVPTAGGDQAIETIFRWAALRSTAGPSVTLHSPSFEMLDVYANNVGFVTKTVAWPGGRFPVDEFLEKIGESDLGVVVTPNNPTGSCLEIDQIIQIAKTTAELSTPLLVDLAYIEFAENDPTPFLIDFPNVFMIRTLSKAWGLAGLRIGCAIAPTPAAANELAAIRGPFPISSASIQLGCTALENCEPQMRQNVDATIQNRGTLIQRLSEVGIETIASETNFVTAVVKNSGDVANRFRQLGIGVRVFSETDRKDWVRISIPVADDSFLKLLNAVGIIFAGKKANGQSKANTQCSPAVSDRVGVANRKTKETEIRVRINLDGDGSSKVDTGLGFLDHMLDAVACHGRLDLNLTCSGDLEVDDHHTVEDCAIALGTAIEQALGDKRGITRFATAFAPLDESLVRCVIDLSGRAASAIDLGFQREMLGQVATENLTHFFESLAANLKCALHLDLVRGENDHHKAEAAFKALALAIREAVSISGSQIQSTKGRI